MVIRLLILIAFIFCSSFPIQAQVFPAENSKLNYRLIGFSFPAVSGAISYKIEIGRGNHSATPAFEKAISQNILSDTTRAIAEVPSFGEWYTWRVVALSKDKKSVGKGPLYHFHTGTNARVDTAKLRLRILQSASEYKDAYVGVDAGGVLYDMKGNPVWFIPDTNGYGGNVADLKFTPEGTITFIYRNAYEINYNGDVLWKAPNNGLISGDSLHGEFYHHEFTRLPNGHFMVLAIQFLLCKEVVTKDTSYILVANEKVTAANAQGQNGFKLGRFGTLAEYDRKGKLVWSWNTSKYLIGSDFDYATTIDTNFRFDPHDNAFYFDEKNKCVYLGFKYLNRIIKISYPDGRVLNTYGNAFKPGIREAGKGIFCNQHNINRSQQGDLYVFNNNSCGQKDSMPTIILLKEPGSVNGDLQKIWEYTCSTDKYFPKYTNKIFNSGGNVIELSNRSLFVNMGSMYSKLFIVNPQKKLQWSALPEKIMEPEMKWVPMHEYRATIITRKEMEQMIWNAQK